MSLKNILIPVSIIVLVIGVPLIYQYWAVLKIYKSEVFYSCLLAIFFILLELVFAGFVGPKSLKSKIRRFQVWDNTKAAILPVHPYKPIGRALEEGIHNFFPTKGRSLNYVVMKIVYAAISVLLFFIFAKIMILIWS